MGSRCGIETNKNHLAGFFVFPQKPQSLLHRDASRALKGEAAIARSQQT
jgi:hypothetical protein